MVEIRKPYDHVEHEPFVTDGESMTEQHHKVDCDVNTIVKRHLSGELVPQLPAGSYEELPAAMDYHEALLLVADAREAFDGLGSAIRNRFNNSPEEFLAFMDEPANVEEMIELGLAEPADGVRPNSPPAEAAAVSSDAGQSGEEVPPA